jgi:hypothetical protein
MGAQLRGVEVFFSYRDERFHIHLPAALSPIIGKHGVLRCRLDGVRRRGAPEVAGRVEAFEADFGADRHMVIPSLVANHCGISGGSALDLTILERLNLKRGWILRGPKYLPIYPNDTVVFDHGDGGLSHIAAPSGDGAHPRLSPRQLARSIERDLGKATTTAVSPSAPADAQAPSADEATDRPHRVEILDLHPAAKNGGGVDNSRGIGMVPHEQPVRQARGG